MRKQFVGYSFGLRDSKNMRNQLNKLDEYEEVEKLIKEYVSKYADSLTLQGFFNIIGWIKGGCLIFISEVLKLVEKDIFFTPEGLEKIENEIEYLKTVRRKEVAERIKIALGYGDLSENSEYDEAKNEQAQVEERIAKLEMMVRNAKVIDGDALNTDKVNIGSMVKVLDVKTKKETVFNIVGSAEADPLKGKISNESPVGAKLIGKEIGDIVEIEVPKGTITYKIEDISL